jgi:hypothetical protein
MVAHRTSSNSGHYQGRVQVMVAVEIGSKMGIGCFSACPSMREVISSGFWVVKLRSVSICGPISPAFLLTYKGKKNV